MGICQWNLCGTYVVPKNIEEGGATLIMESKQCKDHYLDQ
jgi:hypothetical protein